MLLRLQAGRARRILAEMQELPDAVAELRERAVLLGRNVFLLHGTSVTYRSNTSPCEPGPRPVWPGVLDPECRALRSAKISRIFLHNIRPRHRSSLSAPEALYSS